MWPITITSSADTPVRALYPREESLKSDNLFHRVRNYGRTRPVLLLHLPQQFRFQVIRINHHLAISNLLITRTVKT